MKVKSLLKIASKCKTEDDVKALLETLKRVFANSGPLTHLYLHNDEADMEGGHPNVFFDLSREISSSYITTIRPEIRDEKFTVVVTTNRMLDGLGLLSTTWDTLEDMDESIDVSDDKTIKEIAMEARELAIANHVRLIEQVGVTHAAAKAAAIESW